MWNCVPIRHMYIPRALRRAVTLRRVLLDCADEGLFDDINNRMIGANTVRAGRLETKREVGVLLLFRNNKRSRVDR